MGLGSVARQILASGLALALSTYLAPLIASGLKNVLPFALTWFIASLVVFFFVALAAHKALALFAQGLSVRKWMSVVGGSVLMGGIGVLGAGLLLWTIQFSAQLRSVTESAPVNHPQGSYRWASDEVELLTRWSLRASGVGQPVAASIGRTAAEPGFYMQQVVSLATSAELKAFWDDVQAQQLMQQQEDQALIQLLSGQLLLQHTAAINLIQAIPYEGVEAQTLFMKNVRQVWQVKQRLMQDAQIQTLLADGSLVDQLSRKDLLGLYLNPHWQPLLRRMEALVLTQKASNEAPTPAFPAEVPESVIPQT
ncbi:MAG TPA: hypothetical protein VIZ65_01225 [Cellvibrionaceae bacterium]